MSLSNIVIVIPLAVLLVSWPPPAKFTSSSRQTHPHSHASSSLETVMVRLEAVVSSHFLPLFLLYFGDCFLLLNSGNTPKSSTKCAKCTTRCRCYVYCPFGTTKVTKAFAAPTRISARVNHFICRDCESICSCRCFSVSYKDKVVSALPVIR